MILGLMRKHARSWIIKITIAIIGLVFVFYFGYSFRAQRGLRIAKVNGEVITRNEYLREYDYIYEAFRRIYKETKDLSEIKRLALDVLIDQILIRQEARKLGIKVTEEEIQREIMKNPAFQVNGRFDIRIYRRILKSNGMTPEEYEKRVAYQILEKKIKDLLLSFSNVTEKEALDYFRYIKEEIKISFLLFKPEMFKKDVKITEKLMRDFYKENKERYRMPVQIKLSYIMIDPKDFEKEVELNEEKIKQYYEFHMDEYRLPGQKEAPSLDDVKDKVIRDFISERSEEIALERCYELIDRMPYEMDLKEWAEKNGLKIGYTDYFSESDHVIPDIGGTEEIIKRLFQLKDKEVSDPIKIRGKFYIFQLEKKKESYIPEFYEVKDQIKEDLIDRLSMEMAKEEAERILSQLKKGEISIEDVAKKEGLELVETGFFTRSDPVPKIGDDGELKEELFCLGEKEFFDKLYVNDDGVYIIRVEERKEVDMDEFKRKKERIKDQIAYLKRERIFSDWIKLLRKRAKIEIINPFE